ncbi:CDP-diacylglycerol--glycerol-3-phosphate 3-phosphatidyltransferase [Helicobacter enhydrae]|uniref:CDP-diacylglycerol--glycerol-3-phosphate 3-phosphatidyltransferase n=1 Tax=Helicobacter enhydrae TaxID=222136 RepID=A0A1B1U5C2_9HELI|nr:CDP-diacylglycerol--glycerol-3-phosphate 3-phosphatidyltransferase [Helicobacter enhydrae]ANV97956.1 CDP-diacylglycerol--glycerol-3-phosphate 3-phosphatidyltransferase [Helicobacter enhydrae]
MRNIPNALTIFRICLAFLVMAIILYMDLSSGITRFMACSVFFVASVTDFFDGFIARRYGLQSRFGEVFDPLADKMLVLGAFIALLVVNLANPWAVFLIFSREFLITGLRTVMANTKISLAANMMGKVKSVSQYWAIGCLIANILPGMWNDFFLWLSVVLTIVSGYSYVRQYFKEF